MEGGRVSERPGYRGEVAVAERQHAAWDGRDVFLQVLAGRRWYHDRADGRSDGCWLLEEAMSDL